MDSGINRNAGLSSDCPDIQDEQKNRQLKRRLMNLAEQLVKRSMDEEMKRNETVKILRTVADKVETLGQALTVALGVGIGAGGAAALFTGGLSLLVGSVAIGGLMAAFIAAIGTVLESIRAQETFKEYDDILSELRGVMNGILDNFDKDLVRETLQKTTSQRAKQTKTLKIILEEIENVRVSGMFQVSDSKDSIRLKNFNVEDHIKRSVQGWIKPSVIAADLRVIADDLERYEPVTSP